MKKYLAYAAPLAMALCVNVAMPTAASANNGAKGAVNFCKANPGFLGTTSTGECVSLIRTNDAVQTCKVLDALFGLDVLGFKNFGQCVVALSD